jgi:hypothetical protein
MRRWLLVALLILPAACRISGRRDVPVAPTLKQFAIAPASHSGPWEIPRSLEKGSDAGGAIKCVERILALDVRSDTSVEAFQGLAATSATGGAVVLIGHGKPGVICTGKGDRCSGDKKALVAFYNKAEWRTDASDLIAKQPAQVRLLGCSVGSGDLGLKLLTNLANELHCPVAAPTGLVHCRNNNVELDPYADWQVVEPGQAMQPKWPQTPPIPPGSTATFMIESQRVIVSRADIRLVELTSLVGEDQTAFGPVPLDDAASLLPMVDWANPYDPGPPIAVVTGRLTVRIDFGPIGIDKYFRIYSDELLQDEMHPEVFYRVSAQFTSTLRARRPALD